jgi:hypothetical protein
MFQIKQSETTAARRRIPVLFVSSTDGFTPTTPTSPAAYISTNGGTFVATTNAVTLETLAAGQSASGCYYLELTAAEVGTLGVINVNVQSTNCRQYNAVIQVMAYDAYDVVRIGLTALPNAAAGANGGLPTGDASGRVTVGSNADKTGYSLTTAPLTSTQTADAVWNALLASYTTANTFGARIIRGTSTSPSYETFITASNHIACDVHAMQASVITAAAIAANAITSAELDATALAAIADYLLLRKLDRSGQGTGSTSNERTVLSALRYLRNKVDISASTMTIFAEDDTTTAWTSTLTSTAGLNPVTASDPA